MYIWNMVTPATIVYTLRIRFPHKASAPYKLFTTSSVLGSQCICISLAMHSSIHWIGNFGLVYSDTFSFDSLHVIVWIMCCFFFFFREGGGVVESYQMSEHRYWLKTRNTMNFLADYLNWSCLHMRVYVPW